MDFAAGYAEPPARYSVEGLARFVEWVVQHHPDGGRWASLAAVIRSHPDRFIYVPPSTRIVDLAASLAVGDAAG